MTRTSTEIPTSLRRPCVNIWKVYFRKSSTSVHNRFDLFQIWIQLIWSSHIHRNYLIYFFTQISCVLSCVVRIMDPEIYSTSLPSFASAQRTSMTFSKSGISPESHQSIPIITVLWKLKLKIEWCSIYRHQCLKCERKCENANGSNPYCGIL